MRIAHQRLDADDSCLATPMTYISTDDSYFSFELDLRIGTERLWHESVRSKTRNQVRKAQKQAFDVRFGGLELFDYFYEVLTRCWRDLGSPAH